LDNLGGSDPRRRKALGGCQAAQSGVATAQKTVFSVLLSERFVAGMLCFLFSFDLRQVENWAQIQTKVASRRSFAFEASSCGVFKNVGDRGKLLNQHDFDPHDPET
jgi:hypothetical protein